MKSLLWKWVTFVVLLSVTMLLARDWHPIEYWIFARVFMPAQVEADPRVILLELPDINPDNASTKALRALLGSTLETLASRTPPPDRVAVDIAVMEDGESIAAISSGVESLLKAGVKVYFAMHADPAAGTLAHEIYQNSRLSGVGHTELRQGAGLVFSRSVLVQPDTGKEFAYLPTLIADLNAWVLPAYQVIGVPRTRSGPLGVPLDADMDRVPKNVEGRLVIVASSARECRQLHPGDVVGQCSEAAANREWSGPELLVWSLSDLLRLRAHGKSAVQPIDQGGWILVAALCLAAISLVLHLLGVRIAGRIWSPTSLLYRLWIVDSGAALAMIASLALGEWLLVRLGWVLPPLFPALAGLVALLLCHMHTRENLATILTALTRRATAESFKSDFDVFISYSHAPSNAVWVEREIVEPLRSMTLSNGKTLRVFFDKSSINVGQNWFRRINLSILGSRCFLCVWSDDYMERDYCRWELDYAFPLAARRDFLFLPVAHLSDGVSPGPAYATYLQTRQYLDAASHPRFQDALLNELRTHFDMRTAVVA